MTERDDKPACARCRHFSAAVSSVAPWTYREGVGECRRHAPRGPMVLAWQDHAADSDTSKDIRHSAIISPFPVVPADGWCGEYAGLAP